MATKVPAHPYSARKSSAPRSGTFLYLSPPTPHTKAAAFMGAMCTRERGVGRQGGVSASPLSSPKEKITQGCRACSYLVLVPGKVGKVITHGNHSFILAFFHDAPTPPLWLPGSRASLPKALPVLDEHRGQGPGHRVQPPASDFPDGSSANVSSRVFMNDAQIVSLSSITFKVCDHQTI